MDTDCYYYLHRKILEQKRRERAHKHTSSIIIQRHYRGYCARVIYAVLCARREVHVYTFFNKYTGVVVPFLGGKVLAAI